MEIKAADRSEAGALASMLEVDAVVVPLWGEQELAALLCHQLAAPLGFDLGAAGSAASVGGIGSFADLLHHPAPPIELLVLAKDFAKTVRQDPAAALPKSIAAVLYFASITVASRRCGRKITRLSDEEVRAGVEWVLAQPWVDGATRRLFEQGPE